MTTRGDEVLLLPHVTPGRGVGTPFNEVEDKEWTLERRRFECLHKTLT